MAKDRTVSKSRRSKRKRARRPVKVKTKKEPRSMNDKLGSHHTRTIPNFIAGLIIFLGLLNFLSIVVPRFSASLSIPYIYFLPDTFREAGDFVHAIIGLFLIYLGYQLYMRRKGAWTVIFLFLFVSLLASILSGTLSSIATGALTLYLMGLLYIYKDQFSTPSIFRLSAKRMSSVLAMIIVTIYGIVGSKTLGTDFYKPIESWTDAIYFTITTVTTVGYGDHIPLSENAQWFTIVLMVFGFSTFLILIGTMLGPYIESRLQKVIHMVGGIRTERLAGHLIICGLSTEARIIIETLRARKDTFILVCGSEQKHEDLATEGVNIFFGDPSDNDILVKVSVQKAKALMALSDEDALNAFITITARKLNPDLPIIAMASSRENMAKLRTAGATNVISPSVIGAERMLAAALGEKDITCV